MLLRSHTDTDILNNLIGTDVWVKVADVEYGFEEYYIQIHEQTARGYYCTAVESHFVENYDEFAYIDALISEGCRGCNSSEVLLSNEYVCTDDIEIVQPIEYMSDAEIMESIDRYDAVDVDAYFEG